MKIHYWYFKSYWSGSPGSAVHNTKWQGILKYSMIQSVAFNSVFQIGKAGVLLVIGPTS